MNKVKVIVTGSSGLVGRNLVNALLDKNYHVIGYDVISSIENSHHLNSDFEEIILDIGDRKKLFDSMIGFKDIKFVFHTVAIQPSSENMDIQEYLKINLFGVSNILYCCSLCNIKNIIASSSFSVYGVPEYLPIDELHKTSPNNPYGISKLLSDQLLEFYSKTENINVTILRYDGIYGNRQTIHGFIQYLIEALSKNNEIELFHDGAQKRDHVYVGDVVNANLLAMNYNINNAFSIFNIGGGEVKTSYETTKIIKDLLASNSNIIKSKKSSPMGYDIYLSNTKANEILGYEPKKLQKNIELMINN